MRYVFCLFNNKMSENKRKYEDCDGSNIDMPPNQYDYKKLVEKLGGEYLSLNNSQILVLSTNKYINKFYRHPINRTVKESHVKDMENAVQQNIIANEVMTLTIAFDSRTAKDQLYENTGDDDLGVSAIILDGQHRFEAMKRINRYNKIPYKVLLMIYIVNSDEDIFRRIQDINFRLPFDQNEIDKSETKTAFVKALEDIVTPVNTKKRCIQNILNSIIITDDNFISKHKGKNKQDFISAIKKVAVDYKEKWNKQKKRMEQSVAGKIIQQCGLYQLVDNTCEWLNEIKKDDN